MVGIPSPFSGGSDEASFDPAGEFVPEHLPEPGPFLSGHELLTGEDHVEFHRTTTDVFEQRGVYDATFDYNLARLNLDRRHPDAGYRYAREADDPSTLRAEFTPTTPFCPQSRALTVGSFRAWNGLSDRHDYELVRVRVHPSHNESESINRELDELADSVGGTGEGAETAGDAGSPGRPGDRTGGDGPAPF